MAETNDGTPPGGHERRALPVGTRVLEFEILRLIGSGGFGIVYLTHDHSLSRRVALKEYMPPMAERTSGTIHVTVTYAPDMEAFEIGLMNFLKEARLLARFEHPALVKVYRFWEDNGTAYMVMPYYEGATLQDAVADQSFTATESALRSVLAGLLDALALLHSEQCYHRDISPDNILLTANGPVLLDFGAARTVMGTGSQNFTVVLKEGYAPPEQYAADGAMATRQGPWTDIYALAGVVRYAITGSKPASAVARIANRTDPQEPLAKLAAGRYSESFLRAIDAGMALFAEDRPQSVAEFRAMLSGQAAPPAVLRTVAPPTVPIKPAPPAPPAAPDADGVLARWQRAAAATLAGPWQLKAAIASGALAVLAFAGVYWTLSHPNRAAARVTDARQSASLASRSAEVSPVPSAPDRPPEAVPPPANPANPQPSASAAPAASSAAAEDAQPASAAPEDAAAAASAASREPAHETSRKGAGREPRPRATARDTAPASASSQPAAVSASSSAAPASAPPANPEGTVTSVGDPGVGLESAQGASGLQPAWPPPPPAEPALTPVEIGYENAVDKVIRQNTVVPDTPDYEAELQKGSEVLVSFYLDRSGAVSQVFVDRPSRSKGLNNLAERIVKSGRYPPFPPTAWPGKPRRTFTKFFKFRR